MLSWFPQSDGEEDDIIHDVDANPDDDLIKQTLTRPVRLKEDDAQAQRTRENVAALGGMRNPRIAVLVMDALGDATKRNKGPTQNQILRARRELYKALGISYDNRTQGLTQLELDLYHQWVKMSGGSRG